MDISILNAILYVFIFVSLYFQVFLLLAFYENVREMEEEEHRAPKKFPSVTIAVPVWNEEDTLAGTLDSLLALDYPKNKLKIFVIDDGSTDGTLAIANKYKDRPQIEIYSQPNGGKHTAVNFALEKCQTELFGCLDADSFVDSQALKRIVCYFEDKETMSVTPCLIVKSPETIVQILQRVEYSLGSFVKRTFGNLESIQVTPGPFSIFRKKVFDDLGPYKKAHNTEDFEIALRMHKHFYKIVNAHTAYVYTSTPPTLRKLLKQRLRWTTGSILNLYDYRELFFNRKQGVFGLFILPMVMIFIFFVLYLSLFAVYNVLHSWYLTIEKWLLVGINFHPPTFDWFFVQTSMLTILSIISFAMFTVVLGIGRKISVEKRSLTDVVYYLLMYTIIMPIWMWQSVISIIRKKKPSWR